MVAEIENQRIARLTPLNEVVQSFDTSVEPVAPREEDVAAALGKTLAADVKVAEGQPKTAIALLDGFASMPTRPPTPVPMHPRRCRPRRCASMPAAPCRACRRGRAARCGQHARRSACARRAGRRHVPAGADAAPGVLRLTGGRLRKIDVAALTAVGVTQVLIREPRVHVVQIGKGTEERCHRSRRGPDRECDRRRRRTSIRTDNFETALQDDSADCVVAMAARTGRNDEA